MIRVTLGGVVLPFRILRPIQRKTIANKPFPEIGTADPEDRYAPAVLIL
jgi:hypothetical protein